MDRKWKAILSRESITYLDSSSICANGEILDTRFVRFRSRNAAPQEDDDRAVSLWPRRMANAAKVSAGHRFLMLM